MDRRHANQLLGFGRDVISTKVSVLTGYFVMERHGESIKLLINSVVDADPLRKRRLLSTFFVSARLFLDIDIGYLASHFLST